MGDSYFSPIPVVRPSHCPFPRISNAASPRQVIILTTNLLYIYLYSIGWDIIYPRRRSVALPLWEVQSCEVWMHRMITSVNAFPLRPTLQTASLASRFHQCLDPPCHFVAGMVGYKSTNKITNFQTNCSFFLISCFLWIENTYFDS